MSCNKRDHAVSSYKAMLQKFEFSKGIVNYHTASDRP